MGEQTDQTTEKVETKRGRVRRLLIDPLVEDGMQPSSRLQPRIVNGEVVKTVEERHKDYLNRLSDSLAYMSDDALEALENALRFNAAPRGKAKVGKRSPRDIHDEWPPFVAVFDIANALQPCPLEHWPGLHSWFASRAGPEAIELDCEVETFDFIQRHKRPPIVERDKNAIRHAAADRRRQVEILTRRTVLTADDQMYLDRYNHRRDKVRALIAEWRSDKVAAQ